MTTTANTSTSLEIWIEAFDEARALGFDAWQAGVIADETVKRAA